MADINRGAKRRAEEAKMDKKSKAKNTRPKARTDSMKAVRPKARPVDMTPPEGADQEHIQGRKFSGTY